ncbi:MAG: oxidoreductase [Rhodospirillaceae bacterium]|nr:oxidoreductase [Rhodospirillaceae bacterium]
MRIGFIGLGAMGRPMAMNLANAGHALIVHDTDEEPVSILVQQGAIAADSAKQVGDEADIALACLPNLTAAEAVAIGEAGVVAGARAKAFVNLGTTGSAYSREVAERMANEGKSFLDAPISGGPPGAEAATLGIMCSGDRITFDNLKPALEVLSGKIVYLGEEPGAAQTMKLVNNIISFGNLSVALEAMTLGVKAGLDTEQMLTVINASSGRNSATETKIPNHVATRSFDYGGALYIIEKDLELWRREAESYETPMWLGNTIRMLFRECMKEVGRDADITEIAMTFERMAGIKIPKTR